MQLPQLPKIDLSLVLVRGRGRAAAHGSNGSSAERARADSGFGPEPMVGIPKLILQVSAAEGASNSRSFPLSFDYSTTTGMLGLVNASGEVHIVERLPDEPGFKTVLKEGVPVATCVHLQWDPGTQKHLALALRGNGVALWEWGSTGGMQMWSGMEYKRQANPLASLGSKPKGFDPLFARWSAAGMLVLGMADGGFAVYDATSGNVFVSQRSGKHKSGVTAGDWISSLFSPCLALASTSTIKVSQGFDGVEWPATAMKLKLDKTTKGALRGRDADGLAFLSLAFSSSGKYLAALAAPTNDIERRQVIVYEVQDQRSSLTAVRELNSQADGTPCRITWLADDTLAIFRQSSTGGGCAPRPRASRLAPRVLRRATPDRHHARRVFLMSPRAARVGRVGVGAREWPPSGASAPGRLIDGAVAPNGLIAAAFQAGSGGVIVLLSSTTLAMVGEMPMQARARYHLHDALLD